MPDGKNSGPQPGIDMQTGQAHGYGVFDGMMTQAAGKNSEINQNKANLAAHAGSEGPNGSNTWTKNPDGSYTQHSAYSGQLGDLNNILQGQASTAMGQPLPDGSQARDQAINAAYGQATSRLDPRFEQEGNQLRSQLAAQGLDPNSQAYRTAMENFGRERNDAYTSAMNGAIGQGTQAGAQIFNQGVISRNLPLQSLQQMQGLLPGSASSVGLDAYNSANQYTSEQTQQLADAMSGAGQAAGSAAKYASDARIKSDIQPLPFNSPDGVPFSTFRYTDDPTGQQYVGHLAQDVEQVNPDAVAADPATGVKMVRPEYAPVPLTDEQRASIRGLATAPEQQAELERQYARAAALKKGSGIRHTSIAGAALGGLADVIDGYRGSQQEKELDARSQALIDALRQGRTAFSDSAEAQRQGEDKYLRDLEAYYRNGGGNG